MLLIRNINENQIWKFHYKARFITFLVGHANEKCNTCNNEKYFNYYISRFYYISHAKIIMHPWMFSLNFRVQTTNVCGYSCKTNISSNFASNLSSSLWPTCNIHVTELYEQEMFLTSVGSGRKCVQKKSCQQTLIDSFIIHSFNASTFLNSRKQCDAA